MARLAIEEHFATRPDTYLSVGHVVSGAKKVALLEGDSVAGENRREHEKGWVGVDCPHCVHGVALIRCDPCCKVLDDSGLSGQNLFRYADQHVMARVESAPF